jgi:hypothetical protein
MMRRRYGAGPLHLLGHLLAIAVAAYALARAFQPRFAPQPVNLAAWLLAGALLHDLVLLPAYTGLDRLAQRALRADGRRAVPVLNHVRIPAVLSGVLLLVYAPRILDRQPQNVVNALGHRPPDYLGRWLALTAALAAGSAAVYVVRASRAAAARRSGRSPAPSPSPDRRPPSRAGAPPGDGS